MIVHFKLRMRIEVTNFECAAKNRQIISNTLAFTSFLHQFAFTLPAMVEIRKTIRQTL